MRLVLEGLQRRAGLAPGKDWSARAIAGSRISFQGGGPRSLRSRRASASIRASHALNRAPLLHRRSLKPSTRVASLPSLPPRPLPTVSTRRLEWSASRESTEYRKILESSVFVSLISAQVPC